MFTTPTNTMMLAVSLIALSLAFVARMVTERHRATGLKRDAQPNAGGVAAAVGQAMLRTGGIATGSAGSSARDIARLAVQKAQPVVSWVSESDATRFSRAWGALQSRFVDSPQAAVAEADALVRELLEQRGYSLEERADHPTVVTTYLAAQAITARHGRSKADTEAMRTAVLYYRGLFDQLLRGAPAAAHA